MSYEPSLSAGDVEQLILHTCTSERPRSLSAFVPAFQEKPTFQYIVDDEPIVMSATITDLCSEPLFFCGYQSEEEDISASESDSMSLSASNTGTNDAASTISNHNDALEVNDDVELLSPLPSPSEVNFSPSVANFPEHLAEDCNFVQHQCNEAQAVMVVSAGRPKMVQVAKVDTASSPVLSRPGSSASGHTSIRSASRISIMTSKRHNRVDSTSSSSSEKSNVSGMRASTSSPELPSTPGLESGLRTPSSVNTPSTPRTPDSSFFDHRQSPTSSENSLTPTPKPRLARDSSYRLKLPYMNKRSSSDTRSVYLEERLNAPLPSPPQFKPKMVARGANERLPTLELPPFSGQTYYHEAKVPRPFALRKDSFGPIQARQTTIKKVRSSFLLHKA